MRTVQLYAKLNEGARPGQGWGGYAPDGQATRTGENTPPIS